LPEEAEMAEYLGPAGIFSTDDPVMDQMQIEAEQYDPEEGVEPDEEEHFQEVKEVEVFAGCRENSDWWDYSHIEKSNFEQYKERLRQDHAKNCPCGNEGNFFVDIL
jgi:hypothetical protein